MENQHLSLLALPDTESFLSSIGLRQYAETLRQQNIEMHELLQMNEADLQQIGIVSFGHRKRLVGAAYALIALQKNQLLEKEKSQSRKFTLDFLAGYAVLAFAVAVVLQLTAKEKILTGSGFFDGLVLAAGLCAFMSPTVIAWWRGHPYRWAILLGNIFLGGTGLGWVVCLAFAFSKINPTAAAALAFFSTQHKK